MPGLAGHVLVLAGSSSLLHSRRPPRACRACCLPAEKRCSSPRSDGNKSKSWPLLASFLCSLWLMLMKKLAEDLIEGCVVF